MTNFLPYLEFSLSLAKLGFILNSLFGSLLVYTTLLFIKKQFGSYKYLIVNFQVLGFMFSAIDFMFPTFMHSYNDGLYAIAFNIPFSIPTMEWLIALYTGLYSALISSLAIQFIYRYWAIQDTRKLKYFNGFYYLIWAAYYLFFGFLWAITAKKLYEIDDFGRIHVQKEILKRYERNISRIAILALTPYTEKGGMHRKVVCGVAVMFGICGFQYSVILLCGRNMVKEMKQRMSILSPMVRRLHRQFFRALVLQVTAPTIMLFFPAVIIILLPFADLQFSFPTGVIQSGFTLYPAIDSIIMMICVSEYQRIFRKYLMVCWKNGTVVKLTSKFSEETRENS